MSRPITKADAIQAIVPEAQFAITGDLVNWHTPNIPQPTEAEITEKMAELQINAEIEKYRQAVQAHIDATAGQRGYEAGHTLAGYAASAVPLWQAEAQVFVAWRDQVWTAVFAALAEIEAGEAAQPESAEALISELPSITWPKE